MNTSSDLLHTLQHLRHYQEFVLFGKLQAFNDDSDSDLADWLRKEYGIEAAGYPGIAPDFDPVAALWAAKTIYTAGQLLLYRQHRPADLDLLLPQYSGELTAGSILSADMTLRFLPDIIINLQQIDPEDLLAEQLTKVLQTWHYSGIRLALPVNDPDFTIIISNTCLYQLYCDRVIASKNLELARNPVIASRIKAILGLYAEQYWRDFHNFIT